MKKVALIADEQDNLVVLLRTHLKCLRNQIELIDDPVEADIVLVCLTPNCVANKESETKVVNAYKVPSIRIIPVFIRLCSWQNVFRLIADRLGLPDQWMTKYHDTDAAAYEIAQAIGKITR